MTACPFCNIDPSRIMDANSHIPAVRDAFPVSPGHTLVIARRHIASLFEAIREERGGLQAGLPQLEFSEMIGFRRDEYFAAVCAGLDRNYLPMKNLFRDVIERSVWLWNEQ